MGLCLRYFASYVDAMKTTNFEQHYTALIIRTCTARKKLDLLCYLIVKCNIMVYLNAKAMQSYFLAYSHLEMTIPWQSFFFFEINHSAK